MHAALGDHFTVEVSQLFQEPNVLQQHRAAFTCGDHVIIIDNRGAGCGGQSFLAHHLLLKLSAIE
ncbi:hypothetical protein D3C87_2024000 [compost metagenome]